MFFWCMFWKAEQQGGELCNSAYKKKSTGCNKSKLFLAPFRTHSPKGLKSFIKITETSFGSGRDLELPGVVIPEQTHTKKQG